MTFDLPFGTHRYILKELSERPPLQETLQKRFTKFCDQIRNCGKPEVVHLYNKQKYDSRSTFGKNYRSVHIFKTELTEYKIPENEEWKISLIKELLDVKQNKVNIEYLSPQEVDLILKDIACK